MAHQIRHTIDSHDHTPRGHAALIEFAIFERDDQTKVSYPCGCDVMGCVQITVNGNQGYIDWEEWCRITSSFFDAYESFRE